MAKYRTTINWGEEEELVPRIVQEWKKHLSGSFSEAMRDLVRDAYNDGDILPHLQERMEKRILLRQRQKLKQRQARLMEEQTKIEDRLGDMGVDDPDEEKYDLDPSAFG